MAGVAQSRQHFFKGLFNVKNEFKYIVSLSFCFHFNESPHPIYHSKCMCERTFHKDSGRSSPNLTHEKEKVEDKCFSDAKAVVSAPKEHRKQENALWNILFTKLFTMSFSGFWMRTLNYLV